jgi:DNA processing protein
MTGIAASSAVASAREVAAAALAAHPAASAARLRGLWSRFGDPVEALAAQRHGNPHALRGGAPLAWLRAADPARVAERMRERGTRVLLPGDADWPFDDACAPDPPALLFCEGSRFEALHRPAVAIVGTRAASPHGLADAHELAAAAAARGYTVVSGLAIGVDGAAHRGALDCGGLTVGVVGTGIDRIYPRRHADLFDGVRAGGLVVGEFPFGALPQPWHFPVRNRVIALFALVVVVVEATIEGGASNTAAHAAALGRTVMAIPGSRRNPAAAGTNALLRDTDAIALCEPDDLFVALGRAAEGAHWSSAARISLSEPALAVQAAFAGDGLTIDELISRTGLPTATVAGALRELERAGAISRARGLIWPR